MREACFQQRCDQEACARRAEKQVEEAHAKLGQERESAERDRAALREYEGKLRRAPRRACRDKDEDHPKPPLTVSVCTTTYQQGELRNGSDELSLL